MRILPVDLCWWWDWLDMWSNIGWCYRQGTADITEEQMRADWLSQRG